jgi:hypothetical protein
MVFHDSTSEQRIIGELGKIFRNVHDAIYPGTEFYTQVIQFNCRDVYKTNFVNRLATIIDSINNYVSLGWVEWKTITEKDAVWKSSLYDSTYKRMDCVSLTSGVSEHDLINELGLYPNPVINTLTVAHSAYITSVAITDALGRVIHEEKDIYTERTDIHTERLTPGLYFISVVLRDGKTMTRKFVKNN